MRFKRASLQLKAFALIMLITLVLAGAINVLIARDVTNLVDNSIREQLRVTRNSLLYELDTRRNQYTILLDHVSKDDLTRRYFEAAEEQRYTTAYTALSQYFSSIVSISESIIDIALILPDGFEDVRVSNGLANVSDTDRSNLMSATLLGPDDVRYEIRWNDDVNNYSFFIYKKITKSIASSSKSVDTLALVRIALAPEAMINVQLIESLNQNIKLAVVNAIGDSFINVGLDRVPVLSSVTYEQQTQIVEGLYVDSIMIDPTWSLVTVMDTTGGGLPIRSVARRIGIILLLFFVAIAVFSYFMLDISIIRPIRSLTHAANALAKGEPLPIIRRGGGELEVLRKAFVSMGHNITHQKDQLHKQANTDALTGLPNRYALSHFLEGDLRYAEEHGQAVALFFMDLDGFKQVNDVYGHDAGDELLKQVAMRLSSTLRPTDRLARAAGDNDNALIRLGGDEFTVILPGIHNAENTAMVANRLIRQFKDQFEVFGNKVFVGVSIGIALYPRDGSDAVELIKRADTAMYAAKQAGKMRFCFYEGSMLAEELANVHIDTLLHNAVEKDQIAVVFQPKVDPQTGCCRGFEALARMPTRDGGFISPLVFIPAAEQNGLIDNITIKCMTSACYLLQALKSEGFNGLTCAINISPKQLGNLSLFRESMDVLIRHDISPQEIELEITESSLIENEIASREAIRQLQDFGFSVALDDFGVGYSSLSHLKNFSFNTLKIDRIFFNELELDRVAQAILRSIIQLARQLHMTIVAEGIEEPFQLDFARTEQVDLIQGYIYSKPLLSRDAVAFVLKHNH